jgi:RNA polymerase sigma factor (sigma-70 family)
LAALPQPPWDVLFAAVSRKPHDDAVWSELYSAVWPYLSDWVMSRYGLDPGQVEDALQDALLQYRAKLAGGKVARPSLSHLIAFVRYCVLHILREQSQLISLDEISAPPARANPEQELLHKLIIDEALERLDRRCAYMLRSKYFRGFTSAEIGAKMGLTPGNVDTLLHRCRSECRDLIDSLSLQMDEAPPGNGRP